MDSPRSRSLTVIVVDSIVHILYDSFQFQHRTFNSIAGQEHGARIDIRALTRKFVLAVPKKQTMEFLFDVLIEFWPFWVMLAMIVAVILLLRMYSAGRNRMPYVVRPRLVTNPELRFYRSLKKAAMDDWEVFAMVRIADILRVKPEAKNKRGWVNKILAKHIDFVLCDPASLKIVMAIELDDKTHERPDRIERDLFVNEAFASAEVPLLRVPVKEKYLSRELRETIEALL